MQTRTTTQSRPRKPKRETSGSQVRPGPRRALMYWFGTGRIVSLLLFVGVIVVLVQLFTSTQYNIAHIEVEGNNALTEHVVIDMSQLQGTPIWFVDTDLTAERLLQNAYVEQVSINTVLPDTARIRIVERKPEVRWQLGGMHYLVDSNGMVLDSTQEPPDSDTLVIVDTTPHTLAPSDRVDVDALELAQVLALRLPTELNFVPAAIGWDFGLGVFVNSSSGQTIVFGGSEELDRKLTILHHLLNNNMAFTYLDLRSANPYYQNTNAAAEPSTESP